MAMAGGSCTRASSLLTIPLSLSKLDGESFDLWNGVVQFPDAKHGARSTFSFFFSADGQRRWVFVYIRLHHDVIEFLTN